MTKAQKTKQYDLEDRTFRFAQDVRSFIRHIAKDIANSEDGKQVIRSSGSVGANYIEANEAISKKDFLLRIKICRKEAKETRYWLKLIHVHDESLENDRQRLIQEVTELMHIFGAILTKSS